MSAISKILPSRSLRLRMDKRFAKRQEFRIVLDIGNEVEHLVGGVRDGAVRFELRHERQLSGTAEKIKKLTHLAAGF